MFNTKNMPIYYLYDKKGGGGPCSLQVYHFVPFSKECPFGKLPNEHLSLKTYLARAWFTLISKGNIVIYYTLAADGTVTHTSYLLRKIFKFPFMSDKDYHIGPCFTHPDYRGQNIYPSVLNFIGQSISSDNHISMLIRPANKSSIRGAEKAGFVCIGEVYKTKIKRYLLKVIYSETPRAHARGLKRGSTENDSIKCKKISN